MKCLGRTKSFKRCKNEADPVVCHHHGYQIYVAIFTLFGFLVSLGGFYQDIIKPIAENSNAKVHCEEKDSTFNLITKDITHSRFKAALKKIDSNKKNGCISKSESELLLDWVEKYSIRERLPENINMLIYNAGDLNPKGAKRKLGNLLQHSFPNLTFSVGDKWDQEEKYPITRIVYNKKYKEVAIIIDKILNGKQKLWLYTGHYYHGLENRDITIFLGNDFKNLSREFNHD